MSGHIIRNTGSAVTVEMPSGERVEAPSVVAALDMVEQSRSLQQEEFGQINTLDFRTDAEKADGLKISRIDLQARLGDDFLCGEAWINSGRPDCQGQCGAACRGNSGQDAGSVQADGIAGVAQVGIGRAVADEPAAPVDGSCGAGSEGR